MAKRPADRYATGASLIADVRAAVTETPTLAAPAPVDLESDPTILAETKVEETAAGPPPTAVVTAHRAQTVPEQLEAPPARTISTERPAERRGVSRRVAAFIGVLAVVGAAAALAITMFSSGSAKTPKVSSLPPVSPPLTLPARPIAKLIVKSFSVARPVAGSPFTARLAVGQPGVKTAPPLRSRALRPSADIRSQPPRPPLRPVSRPAGGSFPSVRPAPGSKERSPSPRLAPRLPGRSAYS